MIAESSFYAQYNNGGTNDWCFRMDPVNRLISVDSNFANTSNQHVIRNFSAADDWLFMRGFVGNLN